jgi:protein-tyrosine kinase
LEKMSEALERSRLDFVEANVASVLRSERVKPLRDSTVTAPQMPGEIRYLHTRSVVVSREIMRENRIVAGFDAGPYKNACKILATQILQRLRENGWNALAITSAGSREGKSLTAINVAISLGLDVDKTVLLVDADLGAPRIHRYFGLPDGPGLGDYLTGNMSVENLLLHPGLGRFVILPGGAPLANSSEHLGSQKMLNLVKELKTRYPSRIVLFDLPPLLSAADALAFSPYVDAAILVVEEGGTTREEVKRAAEMLGATRLIGTVLNKSKYVPTEPRSGRGAKWFSRLRRSEET